MEGYNENDFESNLCYFMHKPRLMADGIKFVYIILDSGKQLFVEPNGQVNVAYQGKAENTEESRRLFKLINGFITL
jgi:hypothetical protein